MATPANGKYPVDERQVRELNDRLDQQDKDEPGYAKKFRELREKVLSSGGGVTVVPPLQRDPFLDNLLARGRLFQGDVKHRKMAVSKCHENSVKLWRKGKVVSIGTGYALFDEDGLWREHTWGVDQDGNLIETTMPFQSYFGYEMTSQESDRFACQVLPDLV